MAYIDEKYPSEQKKENFTEDTSYTPEEIKKRKKKNAIENISRAIGALFTFFAAVLLILFFIYK